MLDVVTPGSNGLNLQQAGQLLTPNWATRAHNAVVDDARRLACRGGYSVTTTTPISPAVNVLSLHEYQKHTGEVQTIIGYNGGISKSVLDPEGDDISGAVTDTSGFWRFQNYNDKVIGFQHSLKPIVYSGTTFATITESSGTAPTSHNGVGLCAYGRVWGLDSDGQTIKYSGLLDETDWGTVSAGSIDMGKVWPGGVDEVTAIAGFNNSLVVFGKNNIVIWDDITGSRLGLDAANLIVVDTIQGAGCLSQHTVCHVGDGDLLFLSRNGVQSLGRIMQERSNPLTNISKNVRDALVNDVLDATSLDDLRAVYYPKDGIYILSIPTSSEPKSWVFDVKKPFKDQDGDVVYPVTTWGLAPRALLANKANALLMGGSAVVWTYSSTTLADDDETIDFSFHSPWMDLGEELANRLKVMKRLSVIVYASTNTILNLKYAKDFQSDDLEVLTRLVSAIAGSEYGIAEYGLDEYGGGLSLRIVKFSARGTGQYFKVKLEAAVNAGFALQQYEIFTKIGRVA